RSYREDCLPFVGAPPSGRWVVVCEAFRDEGVAPTGDIAPHFVGAPPPGRWVVVCEGDQGLAKATLAMKRPVHTHHRPQVGACRSTP
ncbi:MAG: hypothetical protein RJB17_483, partial [Pseudomonadota bacterium]